MRVFCSPEARAEIAGYIVGKDGLPSACPYPPGSLAAAWREGFAIGEQRRRGHRVEVAHA
jgi:hypothetical protein